MRTTLSMIMAFAIIGIINAQDGNVGIGIDTPSARLHVQDGNIKVVNPDRP